MHSTTADVCRLALRGSSSRAVELLGRRALMDMLRPASLDRDAVSYRLLLRGPAGAEIEIEARNLALHRPGHPTNTVTAVARQLIASGQVTSPPK
jgi:hypothetical protein